MTRNPATSQNKKRHNWQALFHLTVSSAYFYAFMEWLFFATKPSSISVLSPFESVKVLAVTGGVVALTLLFSLVILSIPAWLAARSLTWRPRLLPLSHIPSAFILSVTALIMLDNFTYTVFKFGIISTEGARRGIYALVFGLIFWRIFRFSQRTVRRRKKTTSFPSISLLAVSMAGFLSIRLFTDMSLGSIEFQVSSSDVYPNIIILGSDGLSANYLSAYGYTLNTTPFLNELTVTSLVAKNAFPNASSTTGSTTSVLTGKEPVVTQIFRYPDILSGRDSFEHLPGILKQHGYQTVEIGTPYYVDARRLNLLDGFDIVNNQSLDLPGVEALRTVFGNSPSTYFIQTITDRASERLFHIFFIKEMQNPLAEVYSPNARMTDEQRVDQILELLDNADRPVFVFAHLMDTHGPAFSFQKEVFSKPSNTEDWDYNRYLDSILSFDGHVKRIYEDLEQSGKLENTILVIYTDHGLKYTIHERIPLIIHFPANAYTGTINNNAQVIDIPVTLLHYLDITSPDWMTGTSLLNGEPAVDRAIISTTTGSPKKIAPPFYQIHTIQVIVCQKWYVLNIRENIFDTGIISGHTARCDENLLPPEKEVRQTILKYLEKYGYNVSSLK
jgi:arylsulfatase A-like enzyme